MSGQMNDDPRIPAAQRGRATHGAARGNADGAQRRIPTQALILAGGRGTRLGELAATTPKPLLPVAGRPFLDYLVENLQRHGITELVLSTGHLADAFEAHYGDGRGLGLRIRHAREDLPLGTGGGARNALPLLDDCFLALNGDTLFDCNYLDLALRLEPGQLAALALRRVEDVSRYGDVALEGGVVRSFHEKSRSGPGLVSGGVYLLTRECVGLLPEGPSSIEQDLFPLLAERGVLAAAVYAGFFLDIGLPETLAAAQDSVHAWRHRPCAFFGGEGLWSDGRPSLGGTDRVRWHRDAVAAVKWCNDNGWLAFVLAGDSPLPGLDVLQQGLRPHGAHLDAACPHSRDGVEGVLRQTLVRWGGDPSRSVLVGGDPDDVAAAARCGVAGHLLAGGGLAEFMRGLSPSLLVN